MNNVSSALSKYESGIIYLFLQEFDQEIGLFLFLHGS